MSIQGQGHPWLGEHGLTLTPENPCLAEARDSWGSIFYPVILAFWTDGKSTELGAHPPDCTCELSDNHLPPTYTPSLSHSPSARPSACLQPAPIPFYLAALCMSVISLLPGSLGRALAWEQGSSEGEFQKKKYE